MIRIALNEENFTQLVSGKIVVRASSAESETVEIILSDIGFTAMLLAIEKAIDERHASGGRLK